ncbi:olfactory receptor 6B1-like [Rhinatrema bivittatum]|uniref:olfactory receptor 6B1-like n=1 Tax=Rhinatrema bivittatum TaxID=194408 RepID=UPI0011285711|nr:olfactory receptor 6B1-like [Rhinatrema bivittatum]
MMSRNQTIVNEFILLGFPSLQNLYVLLFVVGLVIYIATVTGNIIIIAVIRLDRHLYSPMYFFLSNFSFLEIWYTCNIVPRMLAIFVTKVTSISYVACISQLFLHICLGSAECLVLAVMAFDRYVAICNPLHYTTIMDVRLCFLLAIGAWLVAFMVNLPPLISLSQLHFCGANVINHFFCDAPPLLKLSCTDTHLTELINFIIATTVIVSSFMLIAVSYVLIIVAIVKIPSGRQKAFSTCASHLTVVVLFYGSLMFMYVRPKSTDSFDFNKVISMFYTVVAPVLNPIIYTLRNREVKGVLRKIIGKNKKAGIGAM